MIGISHTYGMSAAKRFRGLVGWIAAGWILAMVQVLPLIMLQHGNLVMALVLAITALACVAAAGATFFALLRILYHRRDSHIAAHCTGLALGVASSLLAAIVQTLTVR